MTVRDIHGRARAVRGELRVPGDKSVSHRALLLGALAEGPTRISALAPGADVASTARTLEALGVRVDRSAAGVTVHGTGRLATPAERLDCGNSGTTARLLLGVLAGSECTAELGGDASLSRRPMARVVEPLRAMGAEVTELALPGRLPLRVRGRPLAGIEWALPVPSAQLKSALLVAGLSASGETRIREPAPSRDHTERMLAAAGVTLRRETDTLTLRPGRPQAREWHVPGDISSAAYAIGLAACLPGSDLAVTGVGLNPTRTGLLDVLRRMGAPLAARIEREDPEPCGTLHVEGAELSATDIGRDEVPLLIDELPLVAVIATQAHGVTRVSGAGELRLKESDRIAALADGLLRFGARLEAFADGFSVRGPSPLHGAVVDAAGDHRLAMAFAVTARLASGHSRIRGAEWVAISYPAFFEDLDRQVVGP